MRYLVLLGALFCSTGLAQKASDNVAGDGWKKGILGLDLLHPPKRLVIPSPSAVAAAPKLCAIPLLEVRPPGTLDSMHVVKPPAPKAGFNRGDLVQVPAPPCDSTNVNNK